ncbi:MAG: hypothetical protein ACK5LL_03035 [Suipraeoptans sp.]
MPAASVHRIFAEDVKKKLDKEVINNLPSFDDYLTGWQGHDVLIYPYFKEIYRIKTNAKIASTIQKNGFTKFVYTYLKLAKEHNMLIDEQVRLILYGYIGHHMLDAYEHPLIEYLSDISEDKSTWNHGNIEAYLDAYMLKTKRNISMYKYTMEADYKFNVNINPKTITLLNTAFYRVYNIHDVGRRYAKGLSQFHVFLRLFRYDPKGRKKKLYMFLEKNISFMKGVKSFSNYVSAKRALPYMNIEHQVWHNVEDKLKISDKSFLDLYNEALDKTVSLINKLDEIIESGDVNETEIADLIPNISSSSGLLVCR